MSTSPPPTLSQTLTTLSHSLSMPPSQLTTLTQHHLINRALGCLMGSFIGDALGSYCEFEGMQSEARMHKCMQMPGGGPFRLDPGQVTDDSEMALHMLEGLMEYEPEISLSEQVPYLQYRIANQYMSWLKSNPFDIGITCHKALTHLTTHLTPYPSSPPAPTSLHQYKKNQQIHSKNMNTALQKIGQSSRQSLSNGFLMRIAPMACFHAVVTDQGKAKGDELRELVSSQVRLTHSHPLVIDSAIQWVQMLSKILRTPPHPQPLPLYTKIFQQFLNRTNNYIEPTIKQQILSQIEKKEPIIATESIGYFKHAYHFAIYEMKAIEYSEKLQREGKGTGGINRELNGEYFKQSMKFVIKQGGDTDTNACVIGGLMGSIVGFNQLPPEYLVKQLNLRLDPASRNGQAALYQPRRGFCNLLRLMRKVIRV